MKLAYQSRNCRWKSFRMTDGPFAAAGILAVFKFIRVCGGLTNLMSSLGVQEVDS